MPDSITVTLPPEILTIIARLLCLHCRLEGKVPAFTDDHAHNANLRQQVALSNLSQTCTLLRDIAQPILFHRFYETRKKKRWSTTSLLPFARAILSRPDLATHVKHFTVIHSLRGKVKFSYQQMLPLCLAASEDALLRNITGNSNWPDMPLIPSRLPLFTGHQKPLMKLRHLILFIMLRLPNLEMANLLPCARRKHRRLSCTYKWEIPTSTALTKLRKLDIKKYEDMDAWIMDGLMAAAPSLETLSITITEDLLRDRAIPIENLKELNLKGQGLRLRQVEHLLARAQRLETFRFTCADMWRMPGFHLGSVLQTMNPIKASIKHLEINLRMPRGCLDATRLFHTFADFTALETLKIESDAIYWTPHDKDSPSVPTPIPDQDLLLRILPASIKEFYVLRAHRMMFSALWDVAENAKTYLPKLTTVYVGMGRHASSIKSCIEPEYVTILANVFARKGMTVLRPYLEIFPSFKYPALIKREQKEMEDRDAIPEYMKELLPWLRELDE